MEKWSTLGADDDLSRRVEERRGECPNVASYTATQDIIPQPITTMRDDQTVTSRTHTSAQEKKER